MNMQLLDIYRDYLLSSFGQTTATGLSTLVGGSISHDAITRMLWSERQTAKECWLVVKPLVREMESDDGVIIIDDSIEEKPYTDERYGVLALRPLSWTQCQGYQLHHRLV